MKKKILQLTTVHPFSDTRIHNKFVKANQNIFKTYTTGVSAQKSKGLSRYIRIKKYNSRLARVFFGNIKAIIILKKIKPDICHVHDPELLFALLYCRLNKIFAIYDSHESLPDQLQQKKWLNLIPNQMLDRFGRMIIKLLEISSNLVVAATPNIEKFFKSSKTLMVPNYPLEKDYEMARVLIEETNITEIKDNIKRICYVGSYLDCLRGSEEILKVVEKLNRDGFDYELHVVAALSEELKRNLGDKENVYLYNRLTRPEVYKVMVKCDFGLLLEAHSPNHLEALPTKLYEYAGAGLKIMTTDIPLWMKIVEMELNCGKGFRFGDVDDIVNYIKTEDKNEIDERLRVNNIANQKYSTDKWMEIYMRKITSLEVK
jgi:hypothetical protein